MHIFGWYIDQDRVKIYDLMRNKRVCGRHERIEGVITCLTIHGSDLLNLLRQHLDQFQLIELDYKMIGRGVAGCVYYDGATRTVAYAPNHEWVQIAQNVWRIEPRYE
jgi:hypothetical protein